MRHAECQKQLSAWEAEIASAEWGSPSDLKLRYPTASILHGNQVVFNIKGNKYRLLTKISFKNAIVTVINFGTHSEYSKWKL